jgi:hypothetical protein
MMIKNLLIVVALIIVFILLPYDIIKKTLNFEDVKVENFKVVNFSSLTPDNECSNLYKFKIPKEFRPSYQYNERRELFQFYIEAPSEGLPFEEIGTTFKNEIRVVVEAVNNNISSQHAFRRTTHASHILKQLQEPYFKYSGKVAEFDKYEKGDITVYIVEKDKNKLPIIINDSGASLVGFRAYRQLNDHIQINYVFSKKVSIEQWHILDKYILDIIDSFQLSCFAMK